MLRRMGFSPVILANRPGAGDTIIEKLEAFIGQHGNAGYACVLLTPDDEGHKIGSLTKRNIALDRTWYWNLEWYWSEESGYSEEEDSGTAQ